MSAPPCRMSEGRIGVASSTVAANKVCRCRRRQDTLWNNAVQSGNSNKRLTSKLGSLVVQRACGFAEYEPKLISVDSSWHLGGCFGSACQGCGSSSMSSESRQQWYNQWQNSARSPYGLTNATNVLVSSRFEEAQQ